MGERLQININITFMHLPCSEVEPVAMDVAGEHQLGFSHDIYKVRLTDVAVPIDGGKHKVEPNSPPPSPPALPPDYCGSCYGAALVDGDCCNSCADVRAAYTAKGWSTETLADDAEQCKREKLNPFARAHRGEGCRLEGHMAVNKVAGNFHVALGKTKSVDGRLIHQFAVSDLETYNTGHKIHALSFGVPFPGQSNPLDGKGVEVNANWMKTAVYQYFIKIVPTNYTDTAKGESFLSYQYSFTEKIIPVGDGLDGMHKAGPGVKLPGVFFVYELSPFMVQSTVQSEPFAHFLTHVCAIVGGVFTVSGFFDAALARAELLR